MKRLLSYLLLSILIICGKTFADNQEPRMDEFHSGNKIKIEENKPLQELDVPYQVYKTVQSDHLNDIRVFNANSGHVPHKVSTPLQESQISTKNIALSKLVRNSQGIEKLIDKYKSTGIDINLSLSAMDNQNNTSQQDVYIGELEETKGTYAELFLAWDFDDEASYFFNADVEIADDLEHWSSVAKNVKLAQLKTSNEIVKHNKIRLNQFNKKFYRVTIKGEHRPKVRSAEVKIKSNTKKLYEATDEISGSHDSKNKQRLYYQVLAKIPVKQIQVLIQEDNVIANCNVYSRDDEEQNWRMRGSGVIYNVQNEGETLKHQTIEVTATSSQYWRVDVLTSGSGFEQKAPSIKFLWQPHVLTFVARGSGPFTLAYGSAKYADQSANQSLFLQNVNDGNTEQMTGKANMANESMVLGGENVLRKDLIKITPKLAILWGTLVIGSLLLLWMAFSLLKSQATNEET